MKIELKGVTFSYIKGKPVIKDLSYSFSGGNIYVLTGANGSGKTTLSKIICGLLRPQKGGVFFDGLDASGMSVAGIAQKTGYLFQNTDMQLFGNTVSEELSFPYIIKNITGYQEAVDSALKRFGLWELRESFPLLLSGGEKQRLALATVFIREIEFLILDEPSSSIDAGGKAYLSETVNDFANNGGGALIITHDEELIGLLNNPVILKLEGGSL